MVYFGVHWVPGSRVEGYGKEPHGCCLAFGREGRKVFRVCFTATASLRAPLPGQGSAETASPNLPGTSALVKSLPGAFVGELSAPSPYLSILPADG